MGIFPTIHTYRDRKGTPPPHSFLYHKKMQESATEVHAPGVCFTLRQFNTNHLAVTEILLVPPWCPVDVQLPSALLLLNKNWQKLRLSLCLLRPKKYENHLPIAALTIICWHRGDCSTDFCQESKKRVYTSSLAILEISIWCSSIK
jgi:hypothetical protein